MIKRSMVSAAPWALLSSLWRHRQLIASMARREVVGRYQGSVLGLAWSFFNPLLMLLVYTFVFSHVLQVRWSGQSPGIAGFAVVLFVGMIIHGLFSECANRAPGLIAGHANYVRKVVFPLEILPVVTLCAALFHAAISLLVLLVAQGLMTRAMPVTVVCLPLVLLPLLIATLGVSWLLAALGVYLRDVGQVTGVLTSALLFISPVLYPVSAMPPAYQPWLRLNPLTDIIEQSREVLLYGHWPAWPRLAQALVLSLLIACMGFALFQKARRGFADVI